MATSTPKVVAPRVSVSMRVGCLPVRASRTASSPDGDHDGVVGDPELVEEVEHLADALGFGEKLFVDGLHPLLRERARVFDPTVGIAVDHATRAIVLTEVRKVLRRRIVAVLGLLLGVEVVQVAEELVEPVVRGEELVEVAEVVLAELARCVALLLQRRRDGGVVVLEADVGTRHADLGQAGSIRILTAIERGTACGT